MTEITRINKILADSFGSTLDGKPFFRLVWSDSEFEFRKGTYNEFYGQIFLRKIEGVRNVPKYNYIHQRWILERWSPPWMVQTNEIVNHNGYEPLYLFEDKNGNYLDPNLKVCSFVAWHILNPNMNSAQLKQAIGDKLDKEFTDEVKYFEDCIEDKDNNFRFGLRHGSSILAPGVRKGED